MRQKRTREKPVKFMRSVNVQIRCVCVVMFELLEFSESVGRTRLRVMARVSLHNRSRQARGGRHGGAREPEREKVKPRGTVYRVHATGGRNDTQLSSGQKKTGQNSCLPRNLSKKISVTQNGSLYTLFYVSVSLSMIRIDIYLYILL